MTNELKIARQRAKKLIRLRAKKVISLKTARKLLPGRQKAGAWKGSPGRGIYGSQFQAGSTIEWARSSPPPFGGTRANKPGRAGKNEG